MPVGSLKPVTISSATVREADDPSLATLGKPAALENSKTYSLPAPSTCTSTRRQYHAKQNAQRDRYVSRPILYHRFFASTLFDLKAVHS
jgi:hypothetical protein